jgi:hypothetical protein
VPPTDPLIEARKHVSVAYRYLTNVREQASADDLRARFDVDLLDAALRGLSHSTTLIDRARRSG